MIWNRDAETLPPAQRQGLQLERLRAVVEWVRDRVPGGAAPAQPCQCDSFAGSELLGHAII